MSHGRITLRARRLRTCMGRDRSDVNRDAVKLPAAAVSAEGSDLADPAELMLQKLQLLGTSDENRAAGA
jgi:hypothetical protein